LPYAGDLGFEPGKDSAGLRGVAGIPELVKEAGLLADAAGGGIKRLGVGFAKTGYFPRQRYEQITGGKSIAVYGRQFSADNRLVNRRDMLVDGGQDAVDGCRDFDSDLVSGRLPVASGGIRLGVRGGSGQPGHGEKCGSGNWEFHGNLFKNQGEPAKLNESNFGKRSRSTDYSTGKPPSTLGKGVDMRTW
jgi:hypothetical protein